MNPYNDELLQLLIGGSLLLFAAALGFALVVFILHFRNERRDTVRRAREAAWEPLLLDLLAGAAPVSGFALPTTTAQQDHFLDVLLRYARRVRGAERDVLVALARPLLHRVQTHLGRAAPEARARAVQQLATLGMEEYAADVVRALDDPSHHVAMRAARALSHHDHPEYAAQVLARLERFQRWNPRFVAALLAGMGPPAAAALRASLAAPGEAPRARAIAAMALATLRDLHAVPAARAAIAQTDEPDLLQAVLTLLGVVGGGAEVAVVRPFAAHPIPFVRAAALETLARIGGPDELAMVAAALDDSSPWVSLNAGQALVSAHRSEPLRLRAAGTGPGAVLARELLAESTS